MPVAGLPGSRVVRPRTMPGYRNAARTRFLDRAGMSRRATSARRAPRIASAWTGEVTERAASFGPRPADRPYRTGSASQRLSPRLRPEAAPPWERPREPPGRTRSPAYRRCASAVLPAKTACALSRTCSTTPTRSRSGRASTAAIWRSPRRAATTTRTSSRSRRTAPTGSSRRRPTTR